MLSRGPVVSRGLTSVSSGGRSAARSCRLKQARRLATDASTPKSGADALLQNPTHPAPPKPKRSVLPRLVLYSSAAGIIFYGGSTVIALNSDRYHDFFVESVPLGEAIIDRAEHDGWDRHFRTGVAKDVADAGKKAYSSVEGAVTRTFGSEASPPSVPPPRAGQAAPPGSKIITAAKDQEEKIRKVAQDTIKKVKEDTDKLPHTAKQVKAEVVADAKRAGIVFSEGVQALVDEVESVLSGKPVQPKETVPTPLLDTQSARGVVYIPPSNTLPPDTKIYTGVLPLEHQLPPGYVLPSTDANAPPKSPEGKAAPPHLPLVAPAISKLSSSEPVIAQLADSIDHLAGYVQSNPSAISGARDVLETAQIDLTQLGQRLEKIKEEEHKKLELKLDEQAQEYNAKLLDLEAEAQDKLDRQEEDWKTMFDDERTKVREQYRQKLQRELETQQELINQRLKEEVIAQGIELQRRWVRDIKLRVEQERGGRLAKLDDLATTVKRLERVTLDNSSYLDENVSLHSLWSAFRAVTAAIDAPKRKPFREELRVLRSVAAQRDDPLLQAALDVIEASPIPDTGVEPIADLTSWFLTSVSPKVESVALVPDEGAGLLSHVASSVLSVFRFKPRGLVEGHDVLSVLARAEYHVNEKDLDAATRELNQLTGWPKRLAHDWLAAARARLEVQQALEVIQTQATLASLLVLETKR